MQRLFKRLWNDEAGFVVSAELVLVATLLVIGLVVGLTTLRNQVVQELADVGAAVGMISQGYQYAGTQKITDAMYAQTDGSGWDDKLDRCQTETGEDVAGGEPAGISVTSPQPILPNLVFGEDGQ
jgi:Flp pilus assembly pilin Flp